MPDRIAQTIEEYVAQGIHRTGTSGDLANADWMASKISAMGFEPELDKFQFERVNLVDNVIHINGQRINAIPLYDCNYTDEHGITGRLGKLGSEAEIGVVWAFPSATSPGGQLLDAARRSAQHEAIIVITDAAMPPGIAITNAEDFSAPFGPPVVQVSNVAAPTIDSAISQGSTVRLVAHNDFKSAEGINVGCTSPGIDRELAPLVVMTPRSGWWACASERGGGIAAWFEILRSMAQNPPDRDVIFTANTGHELGHTGLDHYLEQRRGLVKAAHAWIHLGANFAAAVAPNVLVQTSDQALKTLTFEMLTAHRLSPDLEIPPGQRPYGEARNIFDGGGRYLSLLGQNGLFHHPNDLWPEAVDIATTERWVNAFVALARQLSKR